MTVNAMIENIENVDMTRIMINWTRYRLPASLVVNSCHDRDIFKVQKNQLSIQ